MQKLGNMNQLAGIRTYNLSSGKGKDTLLSEVWNAQGLRFSCALDKCMDLYDLSYKGINISFQSKNGLTGSKHFNALENEFFEYWAGGMLATCGLDNAGGSVQEGNCTYPIHGRIGYMPAENICTDASWVKDDYVLTLKGTMTNSRLYGRNLVLQRTIETSLYSKEVEITDTITNYSATPEELMILYHFNFGYPILSENSYFFSSECKTTQRDGSDQKHLKMYPPSAAYDQQVYVHEPVKKGLTYAGIVNPQLNLGAYLKFDSNSLPAMLEWKCLKPHDYVVGIEPSNCFATSRSQEREGGTLPVLPPYGSVTYKVSLCIADGEDEISAVLNNCR